MSTPDTNVLLCQCGAKLRVPAAAAGKRIRCPKCQFTMTIPDAGNGGAFRGADTSGAGSSEASALTAPSAAAAGDGLLDEFANVDATSRSATAPASASCPKCGRTMRAGSTACAACGYGSAADAASSPGMASKAVSVTRKVAAVSGRFGLGCALSAMGALVGAVVWYFVAAKANVEVGYIAWGLGVAAGFGMALGLRGKHQLAGTAAAGIAAGGILAAKLMIFYSATSAKTVETILRPQLIAEHRAQLECFQKELFSYGKECQEISERHNAVAEKLSKKELAAAYADTQRWRQERWSDERYVKTYLIHHHADETLLDELYPDEQDDANSNGDSEDEDEEKELKVTPEQWKRHRDAAAAKVEAMTAEARLSEARQFDRVDEETRQTMLGLIGKMARSQSGRFKLLFGPMDILFALLALGSAYKIGRGGASAE